MRSEWLQLGPMKIEIHSFDPFHVVIRDLLSERECDSIRHSTESRLREYPAEKPQILLKMKKEWPIVRAMKK